MPLIKYSGIVYGISGSIGGSTFQQTRGQNIVRSKPLPSSRSSALQTTQRNSFVSANNLWQLLSPSEKDAWNVFAASPPETDYDSFGDIRLLTGYSWFCRIFSRLNGVGSAMVLTPPSGTRPSLPSLIQVFLYYTPYMTCSITTSISDWSSDDYCIINAGTTTLSSSVTYIGTTYHMRSILASDYAGFDFTTAFYNRYGSAILNQPAKVEVIRQSANGLRSLVWSTTQVFGTY